MQRRGLSALYFIWYDWALNTVDDLFDRTSYIVVADLSRAHRSHSRAKEGTVK
jgi:hypothetical protein